MFSHSTDYTNSVYEGVRQLFIDASFDHNNIGTSSWKPLSWLIKPGMTVVLKPNLLRHYNDLGIDIIGMITHGSIIRAVLDYVYLSLEGKGRIIIADSPHGDADFSIIKTFIGLDQIRSFYLDVLGFNLEYYDLRQYQTIRKDGVVIKKTQLVGDPRGYKIIDLGNNSAFADIDHKSRRFYGASYDTEELHLHHQKGIHEYCIAQSILDADVIINLPKMKTHQKCGVTLCMKNIVGIVGNKNYLPHYTLGLPKFGGDQFCDNKIINYIEFQLLRCYKTIFKSNFEFANIVGVPLKSAGKQVFRDTNDYRIRSGNWHGNDTVWRMIFDLNRIVLFCDKEGILKKTQQRGMLSIIDGIVCGEGNGPLANENKKAGFLIMGSNPVYTDIVAASCMGFDPKRILKLKRAVARNLLEIPDTSNMLTECVFNGSNVSLQDITLLYAVPFKPHFGWLNIVSER
jgi:uncharacterized protein (DUF362 family)